MALIGGGRGPPQPRSVHSEHLLSWPQFTYLLERSGLNLTWTHKCQDRTSSLKIELLGRIFRFIPGHQGPILCYFHSNLWDENREGGMHSGWWVCIGIRRQCATAITESGEQHIKPKNIKNVDRRQGGRLIWPAI